jgi:hypothetical protein
MQPVTVADVCEWLGAPRSAFKPKRGAAAAAPTYSLFVNDWRCEVTPLEKSETFPALADDTKVCATLTKR